MKLTLQQTGDTIVEVLIAIVIIGFILTGAYLSATHSLTISRQTQERTEALKLAESQLENLKAIASDSVLGPPLFTAGAPDFCLDTAHGTQVGFGAYDPFSKNANNDNFSMYPGNCVNGFYHFAIKYTAASNLFTLLVRWNRIGSSQNEEIMMDYRLYQ